ncbi:hypothetical protein DFH06DRAFT_1341822 [Mycena polygramma]|nr:hypothetical protein DFH06DRAFT_1341822 [Mycena polygramma]
MSGLRLRPPTLTSTDFQRAQHRRHTLHSTSRCSRPMRPAAILRLRFKISLAVVHVPLHGPGQHGRPPAELPPAQSCSEPPTVPSRLERLSKGRDHARTSPDLDAALEYFVPKLSLTALDPYLPSSDPSLGTPGLCSHGSRLSFDWSRETQVQFRHSSKPPVIFYLVVQPRLSLRLWEVGLLVATPSTLVLTQVGNGLLFEQSALVLGPRSRSDLGCSADYVVVVAR